MEDSSVSITRNASLYCYELRCRATVPVPRETAFAFFSDAQNLEELTPPSLHFRILTPGPIHIEAGTLIDYQIRLRGVPFRWRTEITQWTPPFCFVDRQIRGPYRMWEHQHTFHEVPEGTRVEDLVRYRVPLGGLVNGLFVERELVKIFEYRSRQLQRLLSADRPTWNTTESLASVS